MTSEPVRLLEAWPGWCADVHLGELVDGGGLGREVLVRRLARDLTEEQVAALEADVQALTRLRSPYTLRLLELRHGDNRPVLVYEGFRGVSVDHVIHELRARSRLLPVRAAVELAYETCRGLSAAELLPEELGVVHAGPRPEDVLVDDEGRVKVAGFAVRDSDWPAEELPAGYRAPEEEPSSAAVAYALGAFIVELLSGERPSSGSTDPARHEASVRRALIRVLARSGDAAPEAVVQLVRRCLARDPQERPALDEVAEALGRLVDRLKSARLRTWAQGAVPGILEAVAARAPEPEAPTQSVVPAEERPRFRPVSARPASLPDPTQLSSVPALGAPPPAAALPVQAGPAVEPPVPPHLAPAPRATPAAPSGALQLGVGPAPADPDGDDLEDVEEPVLLPPEARSTPGLSAAIDRAMPRPHAPRGSDVELRPAPISDPPPGGELPISEVYEAAPTTILTSEESRALLGAVQDETERTDPVPVRIGGDEGLGPVSVELDGDDADGPVYFPEDDPLPGRRRSMVLPVLGGVALLAVVLVGGASVLGIGLWGGSQVMTGPGATAELPEPGPDGVEPPVGPEEPEAVAAEEADRPGEGDEAEPAAGGDEALAEAEVDPKPGPVAGAPQGASTASAGAPAAAAAGGSARAASGGGSGTSQASTTPAASSGQGGARASSSSRTTPSSPSGGASPSPSEEAEVVARIQPGSGTSASGATAGGGTSSGTTTGPASTGGASTGATAASSGGAASGAEQGSATPASGSSTSAGAGATGTGGESGTPAVAGSSGAATAAAPAASSTFRLEFVAGDDTVLELDVRCHTGAASGTGKVVIPDAGPGPCKVTGRTAETRLIAMVTAKEARTFTCFEAGERRCR